MKWNTGGIVKLYALLFFILLKVFSWKCSDISIEMTLQSTKTKFPLVLQFRHTHLKKTIKKLIKSLWNKANLVINANEIDRDLHHVALKWTPPYPWMMVSSLCLPPCRTGWEEDPGPQQQEDLPPQQQTSSSEMSILLFIPSVRQICFSKIWRKKCYLQKDVLISK